MMAMGSEKGWNLLRNSSKFPEIINYKLELEPAKLGFPRKFFDKKLSHIIQASVRPSPPPPHSPQIGNVQIGWYVLWSDFH